MFLKMTQGLKAVSGVQAEPAKNDFFVESRKSERSVQNGTDLRPDSGSAASSGSTCDWCFPKSDLYRGAISTPPGAAYLAAGTVRCCLPISKWTNHIPLRLILSSLAVRRFIG